MTLEDFAGAIQQDLLAIRKDMITKPDFQMELNGLRKELVARAELKEVRADMKMITDSMVSKADLASASEDIRHEIFYAKQEVLHDIGRLEYAREIDELRERVVRLEKELGLERRKAA